MKGTIAILLQALLCAAFGYGSAVMAADAPAEIKMCVKCHGEHGLSTKDNIPSIAGIAADIQEYSLQEYREGKRTCGDQPLMCKTAARLTDEQIAALAEYYAAQPFVPAEQEFDAALAEKGKAVHAQNCNGCHKKPGEEADGPVLYGQWRGYLRHTIQQYMEGGREQPDEMMEAKLKKLSPADVEALVNYYASFR